MKKSLLSIATLALCCIVSLQAKNNPWEMADEILTSMSQVKFPERMVSITEFGAIANNLDQLAHDAINQAIIHINQQGGGTVIIPDSIYYTGPITLKSNVRLHLEEGAQLKFSTDINLYFPAVPTRWEGIDCNNTHPLIYAYGETNIALTGKGVLDAQGSETAWWNRIDIERRNRYQDPNDPTSPQVLPSRIQLLHWGEQQVPLHERTYAPHNALRPQFVNFYHCNTVLIEDITLLNSPFWVLHPLFCKDLTVRGVTIINDGPNGDGCDPESCKNVLIENCTFDTGDDCIAIKSGRNTDGRKWNVPSENIIVRNCHMKNGHGGVVIGSEISGGFRNLFVENCTMDSPLLDRVIRIKTSTCRGGLIENIYVRNVTVGQCREAVLRINLNYEPKEECQRGFNPTVRNVYMDNVTCQKSQYALYLSGLDDVTNIDNVNLSNCRFDGVKTGKNFVEGNIGVLHFDKLFINGKKVKKLTSENTTSKKKK